MNKRWFFSSIIAVGILSLFSSPHTLAQHKNTYSCVNYKGKPTTVVDTPRGKIQLIVWESDYFRDAGWTPLKRCQEVTKRFQEFSDQGVLKYITTGKINKYPVICVARQVPGKGYQCQSNGLLITLQMNDNPDKVLRDLFTNAAKVGGVPVTRGDTVVSIPQFIDNAPVIDDTDEPVEDKQSTNETPTKSPESSPNKVDPVACPAILCD